MFTGKELKITEAESSKVLDLSGTTSLGATLERRFLADFITSKFRYDGQRGLYITLNVCLRREKSLLSFIGSHPSLINVETSLANLPVTKQAAAKIAVFVASWKEILVLDKTLYHNNQSK